MKKREPGLKQLQSLFAGYQKRLVAPEQVVVDEAVEIIAALLNIPVRSTQLRYTPATRTLHISHGMVRSEVLPYKQQVLNHLQQRLGARSAPQEIV